MALKIKKNRRKVSVMKKETVQFEGMKVVGLITRTHNFKYEASMETSKILPAVQSFVQKNMAEAISGRLKPGTLICGYYDYESDYKGAYTYFIGEQVDQSVTEAPEGLTLIKIPKQKYVKFTNGPGPMPEVLRKPWMDIWEMDEKDFGGKRSYQVDWELYDERAKDHSATTLDIFIGID